MKRNQTATNEEIINHYRPILRDLSNKAKYDEVYSLSKKLHKKYPHILYFEYFVAVFYAEKIEGYTQKQIDARYKVAATKLKEILRKLHGQTPRFRKSVRNEYYWFSRQPQKQYLLGVEGVTQGDKSSYYSQGVGAVTVAKNYAEIGKIKLCQRWAKIAEKAWKNYFKHVPNWSNSYVFYAQALAYQGKMKEMDQALEKCRKIAKRPKNWSALIQFRKEIMDEVEMISKWKTKTLNN